MRFLPLLLLAPLVAGCLETPAMTPPEPESEAGWSVYRFGYGGSDTVTSMASRIDFMLRVENTGETDITYTIQMTNGEGHLGRVHGETGAVLWFDNVQGGHSADDVLPAGQARLWIVEARLDPSETQVGYIIEAFDEDRWVGSMNEAFGVRHSDSVQVLPGDHVMTRTVGVWANGTSFYTNIAELLQDPAFPAGGHINRTQALAGTDPLPVYVYDEDRSEQPAGSKDTCHFTTIPGYNALLRGQHEGGTNVAWMAPEDGYTRPGNEDHLLYGVPLLFMNTVVSIEGADDPGIVRGQPNPAYTAPRPDGDCFDPNNALSGLPPI